MVRMLLLETEYAPSKDLRSAFRFFIQLKIDISYNRINMRSTGAKLKKIVVNVPTYKVFYFLGLNEKLSSWTKNTTANTNDIILFAEKFSRMTTKFYFLEGPCYLNSAWKERWSFSNAIKMEVIKIKNKATVLTKAWNGLKLMRKVCS